MRTWVNWGRFFTQKSVLVLVFHWLSNELSKIRHFLENDKVIKKVNEKNLFKWKHRFQILMNFLKQQRHTIWFNLVENSDAWLCNHWVILFALTKNLLYFWHRLNTSYLINNCIPTSIWIYPYLRNTFYMVKSGAT